MGRLLEESLVPSVGQRGRAVPVPLDMFETDEGYVVQSDLPGLKPEDVDISVSENVLTIQGEFQGKESTKRDNVHVRKRRFGAVQRSVSLPGAVGAEKAKASFE